jgi:hypothetical protein
VNDDIDPDVLALLDECERVGPAVLIEDGEFEQTNDPRW